MIGLLYQAFEGPFKGDFTKSPDPIALLTQDLDPCYQIRELKEQELLLAAGPSRLRGTALYIHTCNTHNIHTSSLKSSEVFVDWYVHA